MPPLLLLVASIIATPVVAVLAAEVREEASSCASCSRTGIGASAIPMPRGAAIGSNRVAPDC